MAEPPQPAPLVGKSPVQLLCAIVMIVFTVVIVERWAVLYRYPLSTLLPLSLLFGAASGVSIGFALIRLTVYPDRVVVTNLWRRIVIQKAAVYGLYTKSGIYIVLNNGRLVSPTAFTGTPGKRGTSNASGAKVRRADGAVAWRRRAREEANLASIDSRRIDDDATKPDDAGVHFPRGCNQRRLRLYAIRYYLSPIDVPIAASRRPCECR